MIPRPITSPARRRAAPRSDCERASLQIDWRLGAQGHDGCSDRRSGGRRPAYGRSVTERLALDVCPATVGRTVGAPHGRVRHSRKAHERTRRLRLDSQNRGSHAPCRFRARASPGLKVGEQTTDVNPVSSIPATPTDTHLGARAGLSGWLRALDVPSVLACSRRVVVDGAPRGALPRRSPRPRSYPTKSSIRILPRASRREASRPSEVCMSWVGESSISRSSHLLGSCSTTRCMRTTRR